MHDTLGGVEQLAAKPDLLLRSLNGRRYVIKLAFDRIVAALGLVLLALPMLALAALILIDSRGSVLCRQVRVGRRGALFTMYKFRSMADGAEDLQEELASITGQEKSPLFKLRQDPRVTRVGSFLRRSSLDELPQLINVLRGEMSLVGPRPPFPREVERYETWQLARLEAVPGMTGLWQVSGRSELPFEDMVRLDLEYIDHWSLGLDCKILLRTVPAVFGGHGAF